jgi:hypothetical protein
LWIAAASQSKTQAATQRAEALPVSGFVQQKTHSIQTSGGHPKHKSIENSTTCFSRRIFIALMQEGEADEVALNNL